MNSITNKQKALKLQRLMRKAESLRIAADIAQQSIASELSKITNSEVAVEYLPGDGFGVNVDGGLCFFALEQAITQIKETGTIDPNTPTYM